MHRYTQIGLLLRHPSLLPGIMRKHGINNFPREHVSFWCDVFCSESVKWNRNGKIVQGVNHVDVSLAHFQKTNRETINYRTESVRWSDRGEHSVDNALHTYTVEWVDISPTQHARQLRDNVAAMDSSNGGRSFSIIRDFTVVYSDKRSKRFAPLSVEQTGKILPKISSNRNQATLCIALSNVLVINLTPWFSLILNYVPCECCTATIN